MRAMVKQVIIAIAILICESVCVCNAQSKTKNARRNEPAIAVMYAHPELAEEFALVTIKEFSPDPESLKILYCKAKYATLYKAYIVNCKFETKDAYGDMQTYTIQITVQILPDGKGGIKYNALDFKEI